MLVLTPFQTTTTYYQSNMVKHFLGFCPFSLTKCIANGALDFAWDKGRSGKSSRIFHWAEIHCVLRWNKTKDMVVERALQVEEIMCEASKGWE